ncbi:MAG: ATP-dependent DNA helicase RecG [Gammaproteobacteria bacterium]|jgi:ATP-dependent DNA helicase RecG|nr:ATP-dependent DNA helicase RecG [Gammaproteobacteria bacterium]MBT4607685.1 ATP-dependent DNA helicase RecG [Thiotrichales bacterium]MBT3471454.1 ATP-dependent DNA helicase RecG [Gammaproteobacteria bacterium]MBT3967214.1 ATP-dependent DNA helicase RecG [Gammaproteobacteria bacterium]MBT4080175.1 ATP-dependent DNA helicase RecG [Gammaproteobacteria bacterium]
MEPVTTLRGVGPKLSERLEKLQIRSVSDLLFHLPLRYQDRTTLTPIAALLHNEEQQIEGIITGTTIRFGRRRSLVCSVEDESDSLTIRLFHFNKGQQAALQNGRKIRCFGTARRGKSGMEMAHPEYQLLDKSPPPLEQALTPIYPMTEGLHQRTLFSLTTQALQRALHEVKELLPTALQRNLPPLQQALSTLHRPDATAGAEVFKRCRERIALEELLAHHLSMQQLRQKSRKEHAIVLSPQRTLLDRLLQQLPFSLTRAQQRTIDEIFADLKNSWPMQRLLQGDVGSGKTLVALCAALHAVESGQQCALMAPTELLATQHQQTLQSLLLPLGIEVGLLSGSMRKTERKPILEQLQSGALKIVVGTHALFQDAVQFHALALVIIDEQHRFGVDQRYALQQKGEQGSYSPHQLIMTATPIPRTLAMTFYADLDSSVIDELPPGRTPITTVTIPESRRDEVVQRIHSNCQQGRQVYWVCPLVEESELLECQAATEQAAELQKQLPDLNIGLVHGRLSATEKEAEMARFHARELHILVATTVIEVGVDVPNASLMVIENAERLGLSQLHQLRGRVGRGSEASSCVLMYRSPLSAVAKERLETIRNSNDGFEIARKDLQMRGPGELLGRRQTGQLQLKIADLTLDQHLLPQLEQIAPQLLQGDPTRIDRLIQRWIPQGEHYHSVA